MPSHKVVTIILLAAVGGWAQDLRSDTMARVRAMTATLARSEDSRLALGGLAQIGRLVCRYDKDEARVVFLAAADSQLRLNGRISWRMWQQVVLSAGACDQRLGAELTDRMKIRPPSAEALESGIREGLENVEDDPARAADKLEPPVPFFRQLSVRGQEDFVRLLLESRRDDFERSDAVFADTLGYVALQPAGAAGALFALGNYLYTAPDVLSGDFTRQALLTAVDAGDLRVYELTVERPEDPPELTTAYLEVVGQALTISSDDPRRFLLAYQLYPRAAEVSDVLARQYRAVLDAGSDPSTSQEVLAQFRPLAAESSGAGTLDAFHAAWSARRFDAARTILGGYPMGPAKDRLVQLVQFGEAAESLQAGDIDGALALARPLQSDLSRTLLYLGAGATALSSDSSLAASLLSLAAGAVDKCPATSRSTLWLTLAALQARSDSAAAFLALGQSVKTGNEAGARSTGNDIRASETGFIATWGAGGGRRSQFWLRVPGVDGYTFATTLPALVAGDADRVDSILSSIKNADRCQEARIQALAARLAMAFH